MSYFPEGSRFPASSVWSEKMPRIDPITGVPVMTPSEFWQKEADHEGLGRTGADLAIEFAETMEEERIKDEERLRDPDNAMQFMQSLYDQESLHGRDWYGDDFKPKSYTLEEIVLIEEAHLTENFSHSHQLVKAIVLCSDGQKRRVTARSGYWTGSFYEPPDEATELLIEDLPEPTLKQRLKWFWRLIKWYPVRDLYPKPVLEML